MNDYATFRNEPVGKIKGAKIDLTVEDFVEFKQAKKWWSRLVVQIKLYMQNKSTGWVTDVEVQEAVEDPNKIVKAARNILIDSSESKRNAAFASNPKEKSDDATLLKKAKAYTNTAKEMDKRISFANAVLKAVSTEAEMSFATKTTDMMPGLVSKEGVKTWVSYIAAKDFHEKYKNEFNEFCNEFGMAIVEKDKRYLRGYTEAAEHKKIFK